MSAKAQSKTKDSVSAVTSTSVTLDSAPTPGNMLVAFVAAAATSDPGFVTPAGWTKIGATFDRASFAWGSLFYRVAQNGDGATWTFTQTASLRIEAILQEWSGLASNDSAVTGTGSNGNSTTASAVAAHATAQTAERSFFFVINAAASSRSGYTTGYTEEDAITGGFSMAIATKTESAIETPTCSVTLAPSGNWVAIMGAFTEAAASPFVPKILRYG